MVSYFLIIRPTGLTVVWGSGMRCQVAANSCSAVMSCRIVSWRSSRSRCLIRRIAISSLGVCKGHKLLRLRIET